jgi:hypothetical protein
MMGRFSRIIAIVLVGALLAADAPIRVTGQVLDYEKGFVFFTTGDGFRVASNVEILDLTSGHPSARAPHPRDYARVTFDPAGEVTEIELTSNVLPNQMTYLPLQKFTVALSPSEPNPDLALPTPRPGSHGLLNTFTGRLVLVGFTVEVPPETPLTDEVYIMTDQSGWNPQSIRMDRVDALHFRIVRQIASGTHFKYLYTRGSLATEERDRNRLEATPRDFLVADADTKTIPDVVYGWADQNGPGGFQIPTSIPTPFNPAPFPNLPPRPHPTHEPNERH